MLGKRAKLTLPATIFEPQHWGVAVGTYFITAVRVDAAGLPLETVDYHAKTALINGSEINEVELTTGLRHLKKQMIAKVKLVAVSFPEKLAFTRTHTLPLIKNNEIDEAVKWQLPQLFPYNPNEIFTDWRLILRQKQQVIVAVTAVPKEVINKLKQSFLASGFFPVAFEPSVAVLSRLVTDVSGKATGVIELDERGMSMTIVADGVASVTATAFWAETATVLERAEIIANTIKELVRHFHKNETMVQTLPIFITGEVDLVELANATGQRVNLPLKILGIHKLPNRYHAALSAAVGLVMPPESEKSINIMPPGLWQFYQSADIWNLVSRLVKLWGWGLASLLVFAGSLFFVQSILSQSKLKLIEARNNPQGETEQVVNLNQLTRNAIRYNRLYKKKETPELILQSILETKPKDVTFRQVVIDPNKKTIKVSGVAANREAVIQTHEAIMATDNFTGGEIPLAVLSTAASGEFTFELGVKEK